jgi:hypothetical protein
MAGRAGTTCFEQMMGRSETNVLEVAIVLKKNQTEQICVLSGTRLASGPSLPDEKDSEIEIDIRLVPDGGASLTRTPVTTSRPKRVE